MIKTISITFLIFSIIFISYFGFHYNFNAVTIPPYFDLENHLKIETYEEAKNYEAISHHLKEFKHYWIIQSLKVSFLVSAISFFLILSFQIVKNKKRKDNS